MLRAHLTEVKHCYDHPHRAVRTACARCKTPYCDDCLTTRTDGVFARLAAKGGPDGTPIPPLFCPRCTGELKALGALEAHRKRPLRERLRPTRAGLNRVALYLAVISVLAVPMAIGVRFIATTTLTPEELARIRVGLVGGFETRDGTNLAGNVIGGTFIRASAPSQPGHDPSRLIDSWYKADVPGWRSQGGTFPQELVFALPGRSRINNVILRPQPAEPSETWVRAFEVLVSSESAESGFVPVYTGEISLEQARATVDAVPANDLPRFATTDRLAKYVMLRVLSNHGGPEYTSLGEFEVYWQRK